jgi:DNA-binding GntR family transcriptional regulator
MINDQRDWIISDGGGRSIDSRLIAGWLRERIESGLLPPGSQLPGASELATWFAVGSPTAGQALNTLATEGLTELRDDAGIYVRESHLVRRAVADMCPPGAERSVWQADDDSKVRAQYLRVVDEQAPDPVAHVLGIPPRHRWSGCVALGTSWRAARSNWPPPTAR